MLLESAPHSNLIPKVMTVFAGFWVLVLPVLWFVVGALTRKAEHKKHPGH